VEQKRESFFINPVPVPILPNKAFMPFLQDLLFEAFKGSGKNSQIKKYSNHYTIEEVKTKIPSLLPNLQIRQL